MYSKIICGNTACDLELNLNKFFNQLCKCGNYEIVNIFPQQVNGCCGEKVIVIYKKVCICHCDYNCINLENSCCEKPYLN